MLDSISLDLLGRRARLASADPALLDHLRMLFIDLRTRDGQTVDWEFRVRRLSAGFALDVDGVEQSHGLTLANLLQNCVVRLNSYAVSEPSSVLLHAAGAQRSNTTIVFPAISESGKSTLLAGLIRTGFDYMSDEAISIDWDTLTANPYPKPISLDPGAFSLFADWAPNYGAGHIATQDAQWHVPATAVSQCVIGRPGAIDLLVFPHYDPRQPTSLVQLSKGYALAELTKNTFRFNQQPRRSLDCLAEIVRRARSYRMAMNDLPSAVRAVSDLVVREP